MFVRLQARAGSKRQRLLTVWAWAKSGTLERGQRGVGLEHLCEVPHALGLQAVATEAANERGAKVSAAADSVWVRAGGGALNGGQRAVSLESLGEALRALVSDLVVGEAANEGGTNVSAAADTLHIGKVSWRTSATSTSR